MVYIVEDYKKGVEEHEKRKLLYNILFDLYFIHNIDLH